MFLVVDGIRSKMKWSNVFCLKKLVFSQYVHTFKAMKPRRNVSFIVNN